MDDLLDFVNMATDWGAIQCGKFLSQQTDPRRTVLLGIRNVRQEIPY